MVNVSKRKKNNHYLKRIDQSPLYFLPSSLSLFHPWLLKSGESGIFVSNSSFRIEENISNRNLTFRILYFETASPRHHQKFRNMCEENIKLWYTYCCRNWFKSRAPLLECAKLKVLKTNKWKNKNGLPKLWTKSTLLEIHSPEPPLKNCC